MSLNKDSYSDVLKFNKEIGASMSCDLLFLDNKNNHNSYVQATDEQIYDLFKDTNSPYHSLLEYKNPCFGNKEGTACKNMKCILGVSPSLDVFPCVVLKYYLGNIKETPIRTLWNKKLDEFIDIFKVKNLKDCNKCDYFEYCIYCPGMGMYENGFMEKSDICCKLTKIRMDILKTEGKYTNGTKIL